MAKKKQIEEGCFDPVFAKFGKKYYTYEHIEKLREENKKKKANGERMLYDLIPQKGFQEKVLMTQADIKIVGGRRGGGKVQPIDNQVVTPFGLRKLGDLKVGSIISDPATGGMQRVLQIFEHPNHDFYEVMFDDGTTCECGLEHLWKVRQTGYTKKRRVLYGGKVEDDYRICTFEMIKKFLDEQTNEGKHMDRGSKKYLVIPLCEPVEFTKSGNSMRMTDIDPYVIGALIGDGNIAYSSFYDAELISADVDIVREFEKAGIDMSRSRKDPRSNAVCYKIKDELVRTSLELCKLKGRTSYDKFIPTCYKWGTVEQRFALVQGMMDTDGYVDDRGHCFYTTVSERLAEDFKFVIESLGGTAKICKKKAGYRNENGEYIECADAHEIYIKIKDAQRLFRLPRKKDRCKPFNGGVSEVCRRIVGYRHVGRRDGRCITVDSVGRLYMTNDFIVTHNTFIALFEALPYMNNSSVSMYGFRKYKDDIERGIWDSSFNVFEGFGIPSKSNYEWNFGPDGRGARMKMEHLADEKKVKDRFRGVEMAYIVIEELAEHTREDLDTLFALLASNRSTSGVRPKCICTCNPVGKSNKLRQFLDWYIDPETDTIIKERDGKIRYFHKYGKDSLDIVWGDTPEEVYEDPRCKAKIDKLCEATGAQYTNFITSLVFIEGDYADNDILKISDPTYLNKVAAEGGEASVNDIVGVWRDFDSSSSLLTMDDMLKFFANTEQRDGVMRASADVAIKSDFLVIYAFDGHHICDMEVRRGQMSDDIIPFIEAFLKKNGVRKENFTFDENGLGLWLAESSAFKGKAVPFNNRTTPSDTRMWNNLKSECAEKFVKAVKAGEFSISEEVLKRKFMDRKKHTYTVEERLLEERHALKRKDDAQRFEIISKQQMKLEVGHSPDFIEALFMVMHLFGKKTTCVRKGFENWFN